MTQDAPEMSQDEDWYTEDVATFGDRLFAAREAAGMKRGTLAKRLGVKKSTISAWEEDLSEPRANRLSMLAGVLNVSIRWLLMGEGDGLDAPVENEDATDPDVLAIFNQIRDIRARMKADLDRLAKLEKVLRKKL